MYMTLHHGFPITNYQFRDSIIIKIIQISPYITILILHFVFSLCMHPSILFLISATFLHHFQDLLNSLQNYHLLLRFSSVVTIVSEILSFLSLSVVSDFSVFIFSLFSVVVIAVESCNCSISFSHQLHYSL